MSLRKTIDQQQVIKMVQDNIDLQVIAEQMGCSRSNIKWILRKHKIKWKYKIHSTFKDLTGQKFGKLTVLKLSEKKRVKGHVRTFWSCKCDCGKEVAIAVSGLRGGTVSCGCIRKDMVVQMNYMKLSKNPIMSVAKRYYRSVYANKEGDTISFEEWLPLTQLPCAYCGTSFSNRLNKYRTRYNAKKVVSVTEEQIESSYFYYNGLDRVDSSKPHTKENVVTCCKTCNRIKSNMTVQEFKNCLKISCAKTNYDMTPYQLDEAVAEWKVKNEKALRLL